MLDALHIQSTAARSCSSAAATRRYPRHVTAFPSSLRGDLKLAESAAQESHCAPASLHVQNGANSVTRDRGSHTGADCLGAARAEEGGRTTQWTHGPAQEAQRETDTRT